MPDRASPETSPTAPPATAPLLQQLRWFVNLRWVAGGATILGALVDWAWVGSAGSAALTIAAVGAVIVAYNFLLALVLPVVAGVGDARRPLLFAWAQLLLDFGALAVLVVLTGGVRSPLIGFFVLHMVFASLLLPQAMAYAAAGAAMIVSLVALELAGLRPQGQSERLFVSGQAVTLFGVVFLANRITRALRRQRRRLVRQNRRIRRMSRQVRRQHLLMSQHEKMVALGHMASGVAHEIANPLASMDGLLQLAQRNPDRPRPELIQKLREQVARIGQIVQQMRSFAHPGDAQWQTVSPNDAVEQALAVLRFDKRMKQARVIRELAPDLGSVLLIPHALQQVLVNLIANALDATETSADPTVTIRTLRRDGHVLIEVSDNGPGIAREHVKRVFEPFFTTKPVGKGTGLGLSISYSLVQKQGGRLTVRSEPGSGATFVVHLPDRSDRSQIREVGAGTTVISGNSSG